MAPPPLVVHNRATTGNEEAHLSTWTVWTKRRPPGASAEQGFTLTELLVVVVILALLAAIAVPALTRDNEEARFNKYVTTFMRDIQRVRYEAISTKEDRALVIGATSYQLIMYTGAPPGVPFMQELREAPVDVTVADVLAVNAMPGMTYTPPSGTMGGTKLVRFNGTGNMQVNVGSGLQNLTASIFFKSGSGLYKKRVVIFPATAYADLYDKW